MINHLRLLEAASLQSPLCFQLLPLPLFLLVVDTEVVHISSVLLDETKLGISTKIKDFTYFSLLQLHSSVKI